MTGSRELIEDDARGGHGEEVPKRHRRLALGRDVVPVLILEGILGHFHRRLVARRGAGPDCDARDARGTRASTRQQGRAELVRERRDGRHGRRRVPRAGETGR